MVRIISIFGSCVVHISPDLFKLISARARVLKSKEKYFFEMFLAEIW